MFPSEIAPEALLGGVVTLTRVGRIEANLVTLIFSSSDISGDFPFRHSVEAVEMGGRGGASGARGNEKIADGREHADEPLQISERSKALHRPLASPERQM